MELHPQRGQWRYKKRIKKLSIQLKSKTYMILNVTQFIETQCYLQQKNIGTYVRYIKSKAGKKAVLALYGKLAHFQFALFFLTNLKKMWAPLIVCCYFATLHVNYSGWILRYYNVYKHKVKRNLDIMQIWKHSFSRWSLFWFTPWGERLFWSTTTYQTFSYV